MSERRCHRVAPAPALTPASGADTLLIGIGNRMRRDDGVGRAVAARLAGRLATAGDCAVIERDGEGLTLIESWQGYRRVLLIDATRSAGEPAPGTLSVCDCSDADPPADTYRCSSHRFGPAEAVALARVLDRLPARLVLYGIEGLEFGFGEGLTPAVAAAVDTTVQRIVGELGKR